MTSETLDIVDIIGRIVFGWGSIAAIIVLFIYSEELGNGNVK